MHFNMHYIKYANKTQTRGSKYSILASVIRPSLVVYIMQIEDIIVATRYFANIEKYDEIENLPNFDEIMVQFFTMNNIVRMHIFFR